MSIQPRNIAQAAAGLLAGALVSLPAAAQDDAGDGDFMEVTRMSMEISRDIAEGAVEACREKGYQVTAAVADREGNPQVVMRDVYAPEVSYRIAKEKAFTAVSFSVDTHQLIQDREDVGATLNHMDDLLFADGGLIVETGNGQLVGAVGVSGAPGGDIDRDCAQAGIDAVSDRLEFAGM
ncbi:MAG: GlcG/HbpS family heme-binding protein [Thiohalorhabdus sp.]|uniref:GlcG/HbpS family heme-binding protein n=1 Tax=Thiohalorhabdus sp. TaxID=3094134 RepID=UPI003980F1D7